MLVVPAGTLPVLTAPIIVVVVVPVGTLPVLVSLLSPLPTLTGLVGVLHVLGGFVSMPPALTGASLVVVVVVVITAPTVVDSPVGAPITVVVLVFAVSGRGSLLGNACQKRRGDQGEED